jgi:hypothetical protein
MIDTNTKLNAVFTQELFIQLQNEIKQEKCRECHWKQPETCKECQGVNKTVVLINRRGQ